MSENIGVFGDYKYRLIYYGDTVVIKGLYEIKSYDESITILNCGKDCVTVRGNNIVIKSMDVDNIQINGEISDILFS